MSMRAIPLALLVFMPRIAVAQVDASSQDTGAADAGGAGGPCGSVTTQGSCSGNVVSFCDPQLHILRSYDCTTVTATSRCIQLDQTQDFRCAEMAGQSCLSGQASNPTVLYCQGHSPGCLDNLAHANCTENIGPCMIGAVGTCNGNQLLLHCSEDQPYFVDCAAYSGTCSAADRACEGIMNLHPCNDQYLKCGTGLRCFMGACIPATFGTDAGPAEDTGSSSGQDGGASGGGSDAAPSGGSSKSGCSCSTRRGADHAGWSVVMLTLFACNFAGRAAHKRRAKRVSKD
jgi:hypothetical protein